MFESYAVGHFTQRSRLASKTRSANWLWSIWTTPSSRFSSSQSSYSSSSSWTIDSTLLAPSCPRAAVAYARFAGTLRIPHSSTNASTYHDEHWRRRQLPNACEFATDGAVDPLWWRQRRGHSVVVHGHLVVARQQFLPDRPPRQNIDEPWWLDNVDLQILINLLVVGTDVTLQLKHRNEKQVAGRFLLDALARAHLGRTMALQRIADEINDKLQLRQVGWLGDLQV